VENKLASFLVVSLAIWMLLPLSVITDFVKSTGKTNLLSRPNLIVHAKICHTILVKVIMHRLIQH